MPVLPAAVWCGADAQLRYLGVRYIELDVHYIPELTPATSAQRAKVCHADDDTGEEIVAACAGTEGSPVKLSWAECHSLGLCEHKSKSTCKLLRNLRPAARARHSRADR